MNYEIALLYVVIFKSVAISIIQTKYQRLHCIKPDALWLIDVMNILSKYVCCTQ